MGSNKNKTKQKGFTLLEMIVVLGIFGVLMAVVIFNYNRFTGQTILTNMAYELALSVREAQLFGTAVTGEGFSNFNDNVGVKFDTPSGNPTNTYVLFRDDDTPTNGFSTGEDVRTMTLQRGTIITELKVCDGDWSNATTENSLEVIFERPNPEPVFYSDPTYTKKRLINSQIKLESPQGLEVYIIINGVGQISVSATNLCNL